MGLAELYLRTRNWAGAGRAAADLRALGPAGEAEAVAGRALVARGEYAAARELLEAAAGRFPSSVPIKAALSYCLLEAGADPTKAEAALRAVLELAPHNAQAKRNLGLLYRNTGKWVAGARPAVGPRASRAEVCTGRVTLRSRGRPGRGGPN